MKTSCLFLFLTATLSLAGLQAHADDLKRPPNIILIMADDMGYECVGAHGGTSYQTPRLDRLAKEGMLFDSAHANPVCTPSRVKIMTGMTNRKNYRAFGLLPRTEKTFGHYFQEAGYRTAVAGKWQLGREDDSPIHFGFDEAMLWQQRLPRAVEEPGLKGKPDSRFSNPWLQETRLGADGELITEVKHHPGDYGPDLVNRFALDFIDRNKDTPFFLYYPMILVHCPFTPTPDSADWEPGKHGSISYKGKPEYFGDMVAYTDKLVGRIIDKLEATGLRENTLVIFTGDNGTDTPIVSKVGDLEVIGSKAKTISWGTHVPFIASMPGLVPEGTLCSDLIDFSDVLPTLADLAGIEIAADAGLTGRSFYPQLKGEDGDPRDYIYMWYSGSGRPDKAKEFAMDHRYKIYGDGLFYDMENDIMEESPLVWDTLSDDLKKHRRGLRMVIKDYAKRFPR